MIWPVVLLVFLAICAENPLVTDFAIGYISHIIGDSYSVQGVAWLYPFTGYEVLPNGATYVKNERHFFIKLYKVGSRNSTIYKKGNYGNDSATTVVAATVVAKALCVGANIWFPHF